MFFTFTQFTLLAALALVYIASAFVAARYEGPVTGYISTFLGCIAYIFGAFSAAKNLVFLLTTPEPIHGHWGRTLAHEFVINPSDDPLIYLTMLVLQVGTVGLLLGLAYSVYSHRPGNEA